jgi:repressor LexA
MYKKIEKLMKKKKLTQYALAKETGIPQSCLSDWKTGRSNPKLDKLKILSDYFDVPIEYFLDSKE